MELERTFVNDIKKVFKEYRLPECRKRFTEAAAVLSNRYHYDDALKLYGRGIVGVCTAATIQVNITEYEETEKDWSRAVIAILDEHEKRVVKEYGSFCIHPAILTDNMCSLRKATTVN